MRRGIQLLQKAVPAFRVPRSVSQNTVSRCSPAVTVKNSGLFDKYYGSFFLFKISFTFDLYDMTRKTTREKKFACWECDSLQDAENIYSVEDLARSGELFFIQQFVVLFHTAGNLT